MNALTDPLTVLILGTVNGLALAFFVLSLPPLRRPTLSARIAPYLRDQESLVDIYAPPTPRREGLIGVLTSTAMTASVWITSRITTDATLSRRISRLGGRTSIERFRTNQILSI
ncbi:type II secretion system F family protein, partial [Burkholderia multivorans]